MGSRGAGVGRDHTRQKGHSICEIPHPQSFQPAHTGATSHIARSAGCVAIIPQRLRPDPGKAQLRDIGDHDERPRKDAAFACFGTIHDFPPENDIHGPRHRPCRYLRAVFLDPYFLPIHKRRLPDIQPPALAVHAGHVGTLRRFRVSECLLHVAYHRPTRLAQECGQVEFRTDFRGSGHSARDGEELPDGGSAEGADPADEGEIVEGQGEEFVGLLVCGARAGGEAGVGLSVALGV